MKKINQLSRKEIEKIHDVKFIKDNADTREKHQKIFDMVFLGFILGAVVSVVTFL